MCIVTRRLATYCLLPIAALVALVLYCAELECPADARPKRVVIFIGGEDPYWQQVAHGASLAASRCGLDLAVERQDPTRPGRMGEAANAVPQVPTAELAGVIAAPAFSAPLKRYCEQLPPHTKLVTFGVDELPDDRLFHIGDGPFGAGRVAANLVRDLLPKGGTILVIAGRSEAALHQLRGFRLSIEATLASDESQQRLYQCATSLLFNNDAESVADALEPAGRLSDDVDLVVDLAGTPAASLHAALRARSELAAAKLITVDQSDEALAAVAAGQVYAVLAQDPQQIGYQAVVMLASVLHHGELAAPVKGKGSLNVFPRVVRAQEVAQFRAVYANFARRPPA